MPSASRTYLLLAEFIEFTITSDEASIGAEAGSRYRESTLKTYQSVFGRPLAGETAMRAAGTADDPSAPATAATSPP